VPRFLARRAHAWLALGAGALVALSMPPWGWWPLAFVGVALFEVSLGATPTRGQRAARGWLFAAGWLFPGLGWMWYLTAPGYLVAVSLFAGFHALAALAAPTGPWRLVGRPVAHVLAEALRLVFPFGGVPIATLAIGQAAGPFAGVVRIGGVLLLSWLVLQLGTALAGSAPFVPRLLRSQRPAGEGGGHTFAAVVAVVVVLVLAVLAPSGRETGRALRVASVQGGGPQGTRAIHTDDRVVVERHLAATRTIEPGSVDLVVWPENVIDVATFEGSAVAAEIAAEAARIGAPFAVGITEDVAPAAPGEPYRFLNAQVVVTAEGDVISRYDKEHRVPFGEYVPLRDLLEAFGAPVGQVPKDAVAGEGDARLELPDGTRLGVMISFEVFFGDRAREAVEVGGQALLNPTNGSSYTGTILQTQQVASSVLRAIETGRWVIQVSPTGFSAFVSPDGDVLDRTAQREAAVIVGDVPLRTGHTWYTRLGDLPPVVLAIAVLALSIAATAASRRRRERVITASPDPVAVDVASEPS